MPSFADWRTTLLVLIAIGFAVGDLWHFHALDSQTDLAILFGAFAGGGLSVAHTAGSSSATAGVKAVVDAPTVVVHPVAPIPAA